MTASLEKIKQKHDKTATQAAYSSRAQSYDTKPISGSWHSSLADHMASISETETDSQILSLACGTGLDSFAISNLLGPKGYVLGIDNTKEMIQVANEKVKSKSCIEFKVGDVTDFQWLKDLNQGQKWDRIVCCSAFVLLENKLENLKNWKELLKDDGLILIDVLKSGTNLPGEILEEIASHFNLSIAFERIWATSKESIETFFQQIGFSRIEISDFTYPKILRVHDTKSQSEPDQLWNDWIDSPMIENLKKRLNEVELLEARRLFDEKWKDFGMQVGDENGKVEEEISTWIVKAWK